MGELTDMVDEWQRSKDKRRTVDPYLEMLNRILMEIRSQQKLLDGMMRNLADIHDRVFISKKKKGVSKKTPTKRGNRKLGVNLWECEKCGHQHDMVCRPSVCAGCGRTRVVFTKVITNDKKEN